MKFIEKTCLTLFSIIIFSITLSSGILFEIICLTVPETLAWTGTPRAFSTSPIICPLSTLSPGFTSARHGAPMCCESGILTSAGGVSLTIFFSLVFLFSLGCVPPLNVKAINLPSLPYNIPILLYHHIINNTRNNVKLLKNISVYLIRCVVGDDVLDVPFATHFRSFHTGG